MDFSLTEDQVTFKESTIKFAEKALNDGAGERERKGEFNRDGWKKCADFGIHGLPMPEEYGGLGRDILTCVATMEGLGYGCRDSGLLFAINSHIWTCESPILKFGTEYQKKKYFPGLCNGSLNGGHAMTEPDSGSDAFSMKCKAKKKGDRYIINGTKMFITNAPDSGLLLVFAVTDPEKGFAGVSAFIVEKGFPGFSVGRAIEMMGLKPCPMGEVILQDCEVPEENRLGKEGAGAAIFNSEMEWERSCLFATHVGAMEKDLEECIQLRERETSVRETHRQIPGYLATRLPTCRVRLELSRLVLYKVAWLKAQGKRAPIESAIAKLFVSESYVENCMEALQIHGAYGYSAGNGFRKKSAGFCRRENIFRNI